MNDATPIPGTLPAIAVGGGLAGAAFAIELARSGRRVLVLERSRGPHHAVCGEFLSEEAQVVLGSLGLDLQALGATTHHPLPPGQGRAPGNRRACRLPPPDFLASGSTRRCSAAAARAGAEVVRGAFVTGIELGDGAIAVRTEGRVWPASVVALATGKHPLRGFARPAGSMVGFKLHLEPTSAAARDLAGIVQLVFFRGGYVGACLVEDGILSVAWVMQDHLVRTVGSDWPAQRAHLSRQSSLIGDLLAGARPLFARPVATAAIPYGFLRTQADRARGVPGRRSTRRGAVLHRRRHGHCALQRTGKRRAP